ncbi:hypothetical protein LPJ53_002583 [Coemansia erecta]|uniref:Uncharacterized protein n=1 Tax=Coemansia erecta TaxID=147472 RepID=A0A9W8CTQ0_9FUNG|nr:hypothetical protein LPJ53_002583 [Coemansia erecta]
MIHNLETMVLLYLLLGATAAADSGGGGGGGIQTNQMDLLSGIPALLVVFVGIVQIWPSPAQMCRPGLYAFLNWLKDSVENDFYISIHSCDKRCQTQLFEPTLGSINRRICINVGDAQETGCIDSGYVSVDELIDIIQADGNSVTLAELAMTARYPQIKQLSRIITVLRFSPTLGRRVIIFQWLAVSVMYVLSWLFSGWLFLGIKRLLRGLWNDVRRVFGLLPVDYAQYRRFGLGYHIAELAEHRLVFEHLPWVRYSVYYLLLKLAGRKLSIRAWGIEDKKTIYKKNNDTIGINRGSENSPVFEHPMVDQRRLAALIATDKCSAALLLFAISLHSLRVMMLCRSIGFLPAHIITGSFSNVFLKLEHTIIAFVCPRLETVYKTMYVYQGYNKNNTEIGPEIRDYLHLSYSLLLKKLQSPLGDQITGQQQINILINLALRDIDTAYVDWARHKIPRNPDSPQPDIEGIIISDKQLNKLCRGHMNVLLNIHTLLESFLVSNIYWGVSVWLLRTLLIVCKDLSLIEPDSSVTGTVQGAGRSGGTSEIIEMLYLLVNSPFSIHPYEQIENGNAADTWVEPKVPKISIKSLKPKPGENILVTKRGELLWMIGDIISFDYDECFTAPMWCVCRGHCRGICTLIVNELDMYLSIRNYFSTPYSFMMDTVEEKSSSEDSPPEQQQQKQQQQEQQQQEQQAHIAQAQSTPEQTPPPPSLTQSAPTQPFSIHSAPVRPDSVHSAPARLGPIFRRVLPLRLPSVDKFSQQITKEVAMSEGWLQRDRRQRRKDRYTLVSPSGNIRVETDAAEPQ